MIWQSKWNKKFLEIYKLLKKSGAGVAIEEKIYYVFYVFISLIYNIHNLNIIYNYPEIACSYFVFFFCLSLFFPFGDDSQVGIKIAGRNINNLRYADDILL